MGSIPLDNGESVDYPDGSSSGLASAFATFATAIANLFKKRERFDFTWANSSERTGQTGMIQGSRGYQEDTKAEYAYDGSTWRLTALPARSFTPSFTNFTLGNGTINTATYEVVGSVVKGTVEIKLGSTSSLSGSVVMNLPVPAASFKDGRPIGQGTYIDSGTGYYPGRLNMDGSGAAKLQYEPSSFFSSINATQPFTWTTNDEILLDFSYTAAI